MAEGDFLDLQTNLAVLAGRPTAADLDDDLPLCKQVINEAQLECYRPIDGRVPSWARCRRTLQFSAPVTITLGLTLGSRVVTGYAFPAACVGSVVAIGSRFYTYAGAVSTVHYLVEPVLEATGSYSAVLYHNSQPMGVNVVKVMGAPDRQGFGPLSPMTDAETDLRYRSNMGGDFQPSPGLGYYNSTSASFAGSAYPIGDALFYRIESEQLLDGAAITHRFITLPLAQTAFNVSYRAEVLPTRLSADADRPLLVGDLVMSILLPLAREKWGVLYKKYTGANQEFLVKEGDRAREILAQARNTQSRTSGQATTGRT